MELNNRLHTIIQKDKTKNQNYIADVIKSDFFYLINNYFEVDFNNIDITISNIETNYEIKIQCKGDRIKLFKTLP
ncbi:MAG: cell division topological specificity factor MinE [Clostridia bacterium]|nr:cell division topological specificity factor MinE [Clostridia bacterium]